MDWRSWAEGCAEARGGRREESGGRRGEAKAKYTVDGEKKDGNKKAEDPLKEETLAATAGPGPLDWKGLSNVDKDADQQQPTLTEALDADEQKPYLPRPVSFWSLVLSNIPSEADDNDCSVVSSGTFSDETDERSRAASSDDEDEHNEAACRAWAAHRTTRGWPSLHSPLSPRPCPTSSSSNRASWSLSLVQMWLFPLRRANRRIPRQLLSVPTDHRQDSLPAQAASWLKWA
uniref:Uncharacterized protein n=1 Tax=Mycena chlorophos TaxID=658473 RepID=A0ABQ0LGZ2_MYCCL|nr:predicted protein [Mycena chlorophos]